MNSMGYGTAVAKYNSKFSTVISTFFSGYEDLSLQIQSSFITSAE